MFIMHAETENQKYFEYLILLHLVKRSVGQRSWLKINCSHTFTQLFLSDGNISASDQLLLPLCVS